MSMLTKDFAEWLRTDTGDAVREKYKGDFNKILVAYQKLLEKAPIRVYVIPAAHVGKIVPVQGLSFERAQDQALAMTEDKDSRFLVVQKGAMREVTREQLAEMGRGRKGSDSDEDSETIEG